MYLDHLNIVEWADKFVSNELSEEEISIIESTLAINPDLKKEWNNTIAMLATFKQMNKRKQMRALFNEVSQETHKQNALHKVIPFINRNWKVGAVAAAVVVTTSILAYRMGINSQHSTTQYIQLKREIDKLKANQNTVVKDTKNKFVPNNPGSIGGSGFAISNNGYIATNYHVVDGADSIYIQTAEGNYYKAKVVASQQSTDIAILKIVDTTFKFSNSEIPYSISSKTAGIGRKIFSLGYPNYEIVYNEGYISSQNGYEGDTAAYQLDIAANPGQSGSPIIDNNGNLLGLITAKETNMSGATFAIKSKELVGLTKTLTSKENINLPKTNKISTLATREAQIEKVKDFMVSVKVYK